MRVTQAFRFELDPNRAARIALAKHVGAARFAYNWGLTTAVVFIIIYFAMKLSDWARKQGVSYITAWRWFKAGKLPVPARQLPTLRVGHPERPYREFPGK